MEPARALKPSGVDDSILTAGIELVAAAQAMGAMVPAPIPPALTICCSMVGSSAPYTSVSHTIKLSTAAQALQQAGTQLKARTDPTTPLMWSRHA